MALLAFDQAFAKTGWALFNDDNKLVEIGVISTNAKDSDEDRINCIYDEALGIIKHYQNMWRTDDVPTMVIEDIQVQRGNVSTYKKLSYAQAAIMLLAAQKGAKLYVVSPSSWRSILHQKWGIDFGAKRADQKKVAKELAEEYIATANCNISTKITTDIADAICIGLAQIHSIGFDSK